MVVGDSRAALGEVPVASPEPFPPPLPPQPPVEGECCGRGCEYCVWVYYDQALRRYEAALAVVAGAVRRPGLTTGPAH